MKSTTSFSFLVVAFLVVGSAFSNAFADKPERPVGVVLGDRQIPGHRHSGIIYMRVRTPSGVIYINKDQFHYVIDLEEAADAEPIDSVELPIGAVIVGLPNGFATFLYEGSTLFYHEGSFFAQKGDEGFEIIEAPLGAVVSKLPTFADPVLIDGTTEYWYRNTVYRPIVRYGKAAYEIVAK